MLHIYSKDQCCGCSACACRCPKQCITMQLDEEGFLYPKVNESLCVKCGICEKVCHTINPYEERIPLKVYASFANNETIRLQSSSGGIFSILAEKVIKQGGVVFGAAFDEKWNVIIKSVDNLSDLVELRGSKYLQSSTKETYKETESLLKQGRLVLYCAAPCQISGLLHYLIKDYSNLITVDFSCHGVPSPKVWHEYIKEVVRLYDKEQNENCTTLPSKKSIITKVSFRDKTKGWKNFSLVIKGSDVNKKSDYIILQESHKDNIYMKAFLRDMISRPSCFFCKSVNGRSKSDFTIADYWHIDQILPEMDDDNGTSLILLNSEKAQNFIKNLDIKCEETSYDDAYKRNAGLRHNMNPHVNRNKFFRDLLKSENSIFQIIRDNFEISFKDKILIRVKRVLNFIDK